MLRLSDRGYITGTADTPAATLYRDRLLSPYNVQVEIPSPDEGAGSGTIAYGVIELENADGALSSLLSESWEGRVVRIKVGGTYHVGRATEGTLTFDQFVTVMQGTIASVGWSAGRIIIALREGIPELSKPVQSSTYAGTGALEGDDAIRDKRKPLFYGQGFNIEPVLINDALQIYQWHDGPVQSVDAVRDQGVALTLDAAGDVADIVAASTPADGKYITQNSGGYLRLGALPSGRITIDGKGDKTGGVYSDQTAEIARRIGVRCGMASGQFELGSFSAYPDTAPVGFGINVENAVGRTELAFLFAGSFGWVTQSRIGQLQCDQFQDPNVASPLGSADDSVIDSLEDETLIYPAWRVEVRYRRNYAPQDADALSDSLSVAEREAYSQPYRVAAAEDASVKTANPDARVHVIESHYANESDALALATSILAVLKIRRRVYRMRVERKLFQLEPGGRIFVQSSAADLASGRNLLAIAVAEDGASRICDVVLWG